MSEYIDFGQGADLTVGATFDSDKELFFGIENGDGHEYLSRSEITSTLCSAR